MTETYDVSSLLAGSALEEIPAGTNVGILGPSMTGKRDLAYRLIATGYETDEGILCITTDGAKDVYTNLKRHIDSLDRDRVGIINASSGDDPDLLDVTIENVSSPRDLTGISIGTAKLSRHFAQRDISDIRYGLISVSTLLQYLNGPKIFRFLHIYTTRITETGGLGIYTLNTDTHDQQLVNTIRSQFDGVIELRESDAGEIEFRVRGFGRQPTGWEPL